MASPIKPAFKTEFIPVLSIIISIVAAFYFYAHFPERVPSHWGFNGEVNGWSGRGFGAFFVPVLLVGMYILFLVLPYADPKKERYVQFAKVYHVFKAMIILLLTAIYFIASLNGLGHNVNVGLWTPILIGALFIIIGNYMSKIKMNWFIGIRTPWTLSSEEVWNKTHRVGGKLFILTGFIMMVMYWLPDLWRLPLFILAITALSAGTMFYSYVLYRREKRKNYGNNIQPPKPEN
jgi:uncharacterized membrane protein